MSGGQEDMAELGRQKTRVIQAALKLAEELKEATIGHRGLVVDPSEIEEGVNDALHDTGWRIRRPR